MGLFTINPDGGDCLQIRQTGKYPEWSHDGNWIAFEDLPEGYEDYATNIYIMKPNGKDVRQLTHHTEGRACCSTWSPDSKKICYSLWKDEGSQIWTVDIESLQQKQLTHEDDSYSFWTPFNKIVFNRERFVLIMDPDGKNQRYYDIFVEGDEEPRWSHDGKKIVFIRNGDVCVMDADGGNLQTIPIAPESAPAYRAAKASISPDGRKIAYSSRQRKLFGYEIYVMDIDGKNKQRITTNPLGSDGGEVSSIGICWSPGLNIEKSAEKNTQLETDKIEKNETKYKSEIEWYNKGCDLTESGDYEQALACYDKALELNPENADAWMNKGYTFSRKMNKEDEGMDCFKKGLQIRQSLHQEGPNDQTVRDMLAKYYGRRAGLAIDKGMSGKAAQEFENALEYVSSPDLKMNLTCNCATAIINKLDVKNRDCAGFSDDEYNELQKSLELYRQGVKMYEDFSDDDIFKSDQTLKELYDQAKTNIKAFRFCGIARYDAKKGKYELRRPITEEEKSYIKSKYKIELCDSEAEYTAIEWINKGKSCAQSEKYEDALECFDKALELNPENAEAYIGKGYILDKTGEIDKGMEYLEKGLKIEQSLDESGRQYVKDDLARYHMNLAKTARHKGLMERALQELDKALRYEPSNDIKILLTEVYATYIVIKLDVKNRGGGADISDDEYNELQKSLKMYDQVISMYEELNKEDILKSNLPLNDAYEQAKKNIVAYGLFGSVRRDKSGALVNRISNEEFMEKKKMMRLKLTEEEIREKRQKLESDIKSLKQERNKKYNEAGKIAYTKYKNNEPNFTGVSDVRVKWYAILAIDSEINKINREIETLNSREKKSGFFAKMGDLISTTAKQGKSKIDLYSLGKKKDNAITEFGEQLHIDHRKGTITLEELSSTWQGVGELEKQINAKEDEISHL